MGSAGVVHAAAEKVSQKQLATSIQSDLKQLHDLLAKMVALPKDALNGHLELFDVKSLSSLKHAIGKCTFSADYVHNEYLKLHPVGVCNPLASKPVPAAQAQHKSVNELHRSTQASGAMVKPQSFASQAQAIKPPHVATQLEEGDTIGTATRNLMAKSPKFELGIKVGALVKRIVSMTADEQLLKDYKCLKRKIIMTEDSTLRQLQNASEQKLEKFVDFLRVLIDGSKQLSEFYLKFHVGSVVANVGGAVQDMSMEQLEPLHDLLTELAFL